jgi:hypothetical protein
VEGKLQNVDAIYSTNTAFAAKLKDGSVVTWGEKDYGGDSSSVEGKLQNVDTIYSTKEAFAAKSKDSTVCMWGDGVSSSHEMCLGGVIQILSSAFDFAVVRLDGISLFKVKALDALEAYTESRITTAFPTSSTRWAFALKGLEASNAMYWMMKGLQDKGAFRELEDVISLVKKLYRCEVPLWKGCGDSLRETVRDVSVRTRSLYRAAMQSVRNEPDFQNFIVRASFLAKEAKQKQDTVGAALTQRSKHVVEVLGDAITVQEVE